MRAKQARLLGILLLLVGAALATGRCEHLRLGGSGDSLEDVRVGVEF